MVLFPFEDCYIYVTGVTGNKKSVTGVSQEYYLREMDACGLWHMTCDIEVYIF